MLLDASQQQLLNETALRRKVKAGTTVVRRGDRANALFVVLCEKLKVINTTRAGRDNTFDILEAANVFGEVGLFSNGLRTADVIALEDCELSVLRRPELLFAIRRDPTIATVLLEVMAGRISAITTDLEERLALDAITRFALCSPQASRRLRWGARAQQRSGTDQDVPTGPRRSSRGRPGARQRQAQGVGTRRHLVPSLRPAHPARRSNSTLNRRFGRRTPHHQLTPRPARLSTTPGQIRAGDGTAPPPAPPPCGHPAHRTGPVPLRVTTHRPLAFPC